VVIVKRLFVIDIESINPSPIGLPPTPPLPIFPKPDDGMLMTWENAVHETTMHNRKNRGTKACCAAQRFMKLTPEGTGMSGEKSVASPSDTRSLDESQTVGKNAIGRENHETQRAQRNREDERSTGSAGRGKMPSAWRTMGQGKSSEMRLRSG
jgi:hypothetical protein